MSVQRGARGATVDALKAEIRAVLLLPEADPEPPWLNGFVEQLAAQGLEDLEALATLIHVSTTITGLTRTYNPQDIDEMDECDVAKVRFIMRGCGNGIGVHSSRFFGHLAGLVDAQKVAHATKGQRTQSFSASQAGTTSATSAGPRTGVAENSLLTLPLLAATPLRPKADRSVCSSVLTKEGPVLVCAH